MGKMCLNNRFKSFLELICSRLVLWNPDFIILNIKTSRFHDLWKFKPVEPRIFHFIKPNKLQAIQANMDTVSGGLFVFLQMWESHVLKMFESICTVVPFYSFRFWNFGFLIRYQVLWRWAPEKDENWLNKISKAMDMNFISHLKTWNVHLVTFVLSSKGIPSTPQHTDPHPCSPAP